MGKHYQAWHRWHTVMLKKPKQAWCRKSWSQSQRSASVRPASSAMLETLTLAESLGRSNSFHSDHERFFSHQYFGGDDLPCHLADTSVPAPVKGRGPLLLGCPSTIGQCRADARHLTVCQVANEVDDDALW